MKLRPVLVATIFALVCVLLGGCAASGSSASSCTIAIYLCGSNLETKQGLAGKNIDELLSADIPSDTKVVIQTGGSTTWRSHDISNKKLQRYEVRDKRLELVEELDNASMGSADTLRDFLTWSAEGYGSKSNVLVIWDHGGKSADKVCFDENFDYDAIDRTELTASLKDANLPFAYDLLVFDACFMSTLENAAILSDYAKYLVASQEVVPSGGIDYAQLVQEASSKSSDELGKRICDAYLKKCEARKKETAELSLMDLSQTKNAIDALNDLCEQLVSVQEAKDGAFKIAGATKASAIYGSKNLANLFDLNNFVDIVEPYVDEAYVDKANRAIDDFVVYRISGNKSDAVGVSLYYPFVYDRKDFQAYVKACPLDAYAKLLKGMYDNLPARPLSFVDKGSISEGGDFKITLAPESARYLSTITYTLYKQDPNDPNKYALMGTDCELKQDWENLTFTSDFYPTWPSLWGEYLLTNVSLMLPHVVVISAPVLAAGDKTEVYAVYVFGDDYHDGAYEWCALWGGIDENGVPSRDYEILEAGDVIAAYAATGRSRDNLVLQDSVTIPDGVSDEEANQLKERPLEDGRYLFQFVASDIVGSTVSSDYGVFEVTDGQARLVEVQPA
ncbi:MAG: hypothetical protein J6S63_08655 [Atopobiaceae bacterium]|nr:hypothetical protein [Atopobiaceae bacterium]